MKQYVITEEQLDQLSELIRQLAKLPQNVHEAAYAHAIGIDAQDILLDVESQPDTSELGEF